MPQPRPLADLLVKAPPMWTLSAEHNAEHMAAMQRQREAERAPDVEPAHLPVWVRVDEDRLTGSPATFVKAAKAAGHDVAARRAGSTIQVAVRSPHIRIAWRGGSFLTASLIDGGANVSLATYALTMPLHEARAKVEAESEARKEKAAARRDAQAVAS